MHERSEVLGPLVYFIRCDVRELRQLAACLFTRLAAHRVFGRLALLHPAAGQEPGAGEWTAALTHEEHTTARIDARDDRADASHQGVCVGVGVGVGASVRPD